MNFHIFEPDNECRYGTNKGINAGQDKFYANNIADVLF